jgi:hypothetical protein
MHVISNHSSVIQFVDLFTSVLFEVSDTFGVNGMKRHEKLYFISFKFSRLSSTVFCSVEVTDSL